MIQVLQAALPQDQNFLIVHFVKGAVRFLLQNVEERTDHQRSQGAAQGLPQ